MTEFGRTVKGLLTFTLRTECTSMVLRARAGFWPHSYRGALHVCLRESEHCVSQGLWGALLTVKLYRAPFIALVVRTWT